MLYKIQHYHNSVDLESADQLAISDHHQIQHIQMHVNNYPPYPTPDQS